MDLYRVKAGCLCTLCSLAVFLYDVKDLILWKEDAGSRRLLWMERRMRKPAAC